MVGSPCIYVDVGPPTVAFGSALIAVGRLDVLGVVLCSGLAVIIVWGLTAGAEARKFPCVPGQLKYSRRNAVRSRPPKWHAPAGSILLVQTCKSSDETVILSRTYWLLLRSSCRLEDTKEHISIVVHQKSTLASLFSSYEMSDL